MPQILIFIRRTLILTLVVFAFSLPAVAVTLAEYRENIVHLKEDFDEMLAPSENSTAAENLSFEREVLTEIPKLLPVKDEVQWQNSTVEVNNQWIYEALRRFENEPRESAQRQLILAEIRERLAALEVKLDEIEKRAAAENTKDSDKQKLDEILRRPEYQKPEEKQEDLIKNLITKILEWLAKLFPRSESAPSAENNPSSFAFVLQMFLLALILGVIGFLIYRFAPFLTGKFPLKEKRDKKERVVLGERLAENATPQNLFREAENLARAGNLRGAIRQGYIALLCELSDKKIIRLSQHKTNRDYLRDVRRSRSELHADLNDLTVNYERHWYGYKNAEETDWEDFKSGYRKALGNNN